MKKTRESFFQENSFQSYNPTMMNPAPYQAANSSFYAGPMPTMPNNYNINQTDLESRLSKMERQIQKLEYRIKTLENNANLFSSNDSIDNNTNMYML